jgi:hypothetical protein
MIIYTSLHYVHIKPKSQAGKRIVKGSRLENYLAILQVLFHTRHPLKFVEIEKATALDQPDLENALSFLLKQKAIGKKPYGSSDAFFVEPSGASLVRYFSMHNPKSLL